MNVLEMWCCLLFKCLPRASLEEWLGQELAVGESINSMNVACPLDAWDAMRSKVSYELLRGAGEPLANSYYWDRKRGTLRPRTSIVPVVHPASPPLPATNSNIIKAMGYSWAFDQIAMGGILGFSFAAIFFWKLRNPVLINRLA